MTRTFRNAFLDALEQTGQSLASVAKGAKVSLEQLKKLKQRDTATTNVDDARRIANHFGMRLDDFIDGEVTEEDIEMLDLLHQLEPQERQFLRTAAKAQIDARNRSQK